MGEADINPGLLRNASRSQLFRASSTKTYVPGIASTVFETVLPTRAPVGWQLTEVHNESGAGWERNGRLVSRGNYPQDSS